MPPFAGVIVQLFQKKDSERAELPAYATITDLRSMHPSQLQIKDFTYHLPDERIARYPLAERDQSKLLIYKNGSIREDVYRNIAQHLPKDTLLLFNNTRVIEARMLFEKASGSIIELFCLEPAADLELTTAMSATGKVRWNCLVGGAAKWKQSLLEKKLRTKSGDLSLYAEMIERRPDNFLIEFSWTDKELSFAEVLHLAGVLPLPPYLQRKTEEADYERYQTVYAKQEGSVAAPTAGLHFTDALLNELQQKGIAEEYVTLHVGAGTFRPVKADTMQQHDMHKEWIQVKRSTIENILNYQSRTIIPVGTTSLRTLETLYWMGVKAYMNPSAAIYELEIQQWDVYDLLQQSVSVETALQALLHCMQVHGQNELICHTQILLAPGYQPRIAAALITNFHQPDSTLLLLVAALVGEDWRKIYDYALQNDFRFLSYGDGSLLWIKQADN